ncbi:ankyrin repeat domain-containing protein [Pontiellaceae bacterium B12227]|nr:ankyrin repeat domain-containing protein [Pontiellaceae bacterium B12227]
MADLFIVKERLKFSLILSLIGVGLGLLATWHFWNQLEFETDNSKFLLSATITGALMIGSVGLFLFYLSAKRVVDPAHSFTDRFDSIPWWLIKVFLVLAVIVVAGFFIIRHRGEAQDEFELLRSGEIALLAERIEAYPVLLDRLDPKSGSTLLQLAYRENRPEAVQLMIDHGASVAELEVQGVSPIVASLQNIPMLEVLLEGGFNPDEAGPDGIAPLHYAVAADALPAVELLLQAGAKIDGRDKIYRTPMMQAAEAGNLPMVGALIRLGSNPDAFDQRGDTALHLAVRRRNPEMINLLLEQGADSRIFNFAHMTPLHIAAQAGQDRLVAIFLEIPNMTGLVDEADKSPFDLALGARKYTTCELLLEGGADINRQDLDKSTQLHKAIAEKDYSTARFLIRAGADTDIKDRAGRTALYMVRSKELHGLEDLILGHDNPTNTVDTAITP